MTGSSLTGRLVRKTGTAVSLRMANTALAFITSVVMARSLGAGGFGVYSAGMAVAATLAVFGALGLGPLALRETARASVTQDWSVVRGLYAWSPILVLVATTAAVACGLLYGVTTGLSTPVLVAAMFSVPWLALSAVRQGFLQGLEKIFFALSPEFLLRPVFVLIGISIFIYFSESSPGAFMAIFAFSTVAAFGVGTWNLHRSRPHSWVQSDTRSIRVRSWLASSAPLTLFALLTVLDAQLGVIVLGALGSNAEAGGFAVAVRGLDVLTFGVTAVNTALAPSLARAAASEDWGEVSKICRRAVLLGCIVIWPAGLSLLFGADMFMGVFGMGFVGSSAALQVMVATQMLTVLLGPGAMLLIMSGRERRATLALVVGLVANLGLSVVLAPTYGETGVAVGRGAGMFSWSLVLAITCMRSVNIWPGARPVNFGRFGSRKAEVISQ